MSVRPVIPPAHPRLTSISPEGHTLDVLSERLQKTESDTKVLLEQLADAGFKNKTPLTGTRDTGLRVRGTISPYQARSTEPETLQKNYEALVSRVCRTESTVQSLKLTLCNLQAEKDLARKDNAITNERLLQVRDASEKEIKKLKKELNLVKSKHREILEKEEQQQGQMRQLKLQLDTAILAQTDLETASQDFSFMKQKLMRKNAELKEDLTREKNLRAGLEDSHNTLLTRIHQLEQVVEHERHEIKNLTTDCAVLKKHRTTFKQESHEEQQLKERFAKQIFSLTQETERKSVLIKSLEEDKKLLMGEMGKIQAGYIDLNKQLSNMEQLFNEHRDTHLQLEKENQTLTKSLKNAVEERDKIVAHFQQQLQAERDTMIQELGQENVDEINQELKQKDKLCYQLQRKCQTSEQQLLKLKTDWEQQEQEHVDVIAHLEEQLKNTQKEMIGERNEREKFEQEVTSLQSQLNIAQQQTEHSVKDKENLLEEVNQAVDVMTTEKTRLETEVQEVHVEIQTLTSLNSQLGEENKHLLERVSSLEQLEHNQQQVTEMLTALVEQKNQLAYEKGQLQARLEQLETQLFEVTGTQDNVSQLKTGFQSLQAKLTKSQNEVSNLKLIIQRQENQLRQLESVSMRKEQDFDLAVQARNEALKEVEKLKQNMGMAVEKERYKIQGLTKTIENSKMDKSKLTSTVQEVMVSYTQLQANMAEVLSELGNKDNLIEQLKSQKSENQKIIHSLQKELESLQTQLMAIESIETNEIDPLKKALEQSRADNTKMTNTLEDLIMANGQLQQTLKMAQGEMAKKTKQINLLQDMRNQEAEEAKSEVALYEERITNIKNQLQSNTDQTIKRNIKEINELKKIQENLLAKNGELSRTNKNLRQQNNDLQSQIQELNKKLSAFKSQVDHLQKLRKQHETSIAQLQSIHSDVENLEVVKNEYIRKNEEQASMIQTFMSNIAGLQKELQSLTAMQLESSHIVEEQHTQIQQDTDKYSQLWIKYQEGCRRQQELEELSRKTEEKLAEVQNESVQISSNLHDAHHWFKSKFDNLQTELYKSRQSKEMLERTTYEQQMTIEEEKQKAQQISDRAKAMIQASRKTLSKLADHAEVNDLETHSMIGDLQRQLENERGHSKYMERKYHQLNDASARRMEDLMRQISYVPNEPT